MFHGNRTEEGVIYYLEPESVAATLDTVASQCAAGSVIAFDYFGMVALGGKGPLLLRIGTKIIQVTREPWRFAISTDPPAREQVAELLESHRLTLERFEPFGQENAEKKPFEVHCHSDSIAELKRILIQHDKELGSSRK